MKFVLLGLFCLQTAFALTPFQALVEEWETWKMQYGKSYHPSNSKVNADLGEFSQEESFRMKVWIENKAFIMKHNRQYYKGVHTYRLAMNAFGDLLGHEFVSKMNGYRSRAAEQKRNGSRYLMPAHSPSLPDDIDWRAQGAVTPVKDQGACGSCWAFSTTGALEAMHQRATGELVSLSEQQLIDCAGDYDTHGCSGGWMDNAFKYIADNGGLDTEDSYPYEAEDDLQCHYDPSDNGATDVGFVDIDSGDEDALQSAIATQGPCSVAIDASHQTFQFYQDGVYSDPDCNPQDLDHGVLVVGYGSEDGQDYWLIKNSWGDGWGEGGYIKIARNEDNMCGVASAASYPLV